MQVCPWIVLCTAHKWIKKSNENLLVVGTKTISQRQTELGLYFTALITTNWYIRSYFLFVHRRVYTKTLYQAWGFSSLRSIISYFIHERVCTSATESKTQTQNYFDYSQRTVNDWTDTLKEPIHWLVRRKIPLRNIQLHLVDHWNWFDRKNLIKFHRKPEHDSRFWSSLSLSSSQI